MSPKTPLLLVLELTFLAFQPAFPRTGVPDQTTAVPTAQPPATALWERAIAAKGGRDRLYQVHNLVVNQVHSYRWIIRRHERREVSLYVFPNKLWAWSDNRPGILGLIIKIYNAEARQGWSFRDSRIECLRVIERSGGSEPEPAPDLQVDEHTCAFPDTTSIGTFDNYSIRDPVCFLLETSWVRPVPIKAETVKSEFGEVDAVHTHVEAYGRRYRVVFFLDRKTHLPVKVGFRNLDSPLPLQDPQDLTSLVNYYGWISLSDYAEVAGIQMPRKLGYEGARPAIPVSFEINVDYDEAVFSRPPSIEAGPEAWRPKRKSQ